MIQSDILFLFNRDIQKLKNELLSYQNESELWMIRDGISNSAGHLTLHLIGNLNQFIGNVLGRSGYIRNRELEFSSSPISRTQLIQQIDQTGEMVKSVLSQLSDSQIQSDYTQPFNSEIKSTGQVLIHLYGHLNYHLGQINYHRRLV